MKKNIRQSEIIAILRELREDEARDPARRVRGRKAFLAQAEKLRQGVSESPIERLNRWIGPAFPFPTSKQERQPMMKVLSAALLAFVLLVGGTVATALASQDSLPGDTLYPVKTGLEQVELALTSDLAGDFELLLSFATSRLDEMAVLLEAGRFDDAEHAAEAYEELIDEARDIIDQIRQVDPALAAELEAELQVSLDQFAATIAELLADYPELAEDFLHDVLDFTDDEHELHGEEDEVEDDEDDDDLDHEGEDDEAEDDASLGDDDEHDETDDSEHDETEETDDDD